MRPAPFTLRPERAADDRVLQRLYASTRAAELQRVPWSDAQKAAFCAQQFDAQRRHYRAHYDGAAFDVVEVAGAVVGRLYVHRRRGEIRVMDIAVLPEHRGDGLGTRLMRAVLDEGRAASTPVSIHVEHANPALAWYRRLGFVTVADTGAYFLMRWSPRDDGDARPALEPPP